MQAKFIIIRKKHFSIMLIWLLFSLMPFICLAQTGSALQFNQVRLLTATSDNTANQWTVPYDCVWKIEAFGTGSSSSNNPLRIYVNNLIAFDYRAAYYSSSYSGPLNKYGDYSGFLWLPANSTLGTVAPSSTYFRWISLIEYKVIP